MALQSVVLLLLLNRAAAVGALLSQSESQTFTVLILAAIVLQLLIAVAAWVGCQKLFTDRLNSLIENCRRFAQGQQLLPRLGGHDELSELDHNLRNMANAVDEAIKGKTEVMAMVTHDVKLPLQSIRGTLNLIATGKYGDTLSSKTVGIIESLEHEIDRLVKIMRDLLVIDKIEAGKLKLQPDQIPAAYFLEGACQAVRGMADSKGIDLLCPSSDLEVYADGDRMVQVLVNLLSNAIKYSPAGSTVSLSISQDESSFEVKVSDQGPGIPSEFLPLVFNRFEQAPNARGLRYSGTGLGLAICKDIVEAHGGTIGVESDLGKGSVFWLRVPRSAEAVKAAQPA